MAERAVDKKPKREQDPEDKQLDHKGATGRFVPCPVGEWSHPSVRIGIEIKYSLFTKNEKKHKQKVTYYWFRCGFCGVRVFLHAWRRTSGMTVVEAEQRGFVLPELTEERRIELLAELGLKPVPLQQPQQQAASLLPPWPYSPPQLPYTM